MDALPDWLAPKPATPKRRDNPWNLTPAEVKALDLVIQHFGSNAASRVTGISLRTIETQLRRARARMGVPTYDRLGYVLLWDRWRQGEGKGVPA